MDKVSCQILYESLKIMCSVSPCFEKYGGDESVLIVMKTYMYNNAFQAHNFVLWLFFSALSKYVIGEGWNETMSFCVG